MDGQYRKGDRTMSTNEWLLTSDFWKFLEPWHGRWYENEIFISPWTDNIYDLQNETWLLGDMIDHDGIYGSGVAEGLSAFNVGLVIIYDGMPEGSRWLPYARLMNPMCIVVGWAFDLLPNNTQGICNRNYITLNKCTVMNKCPQCLLCLQGILTLGVPRDFPKFRRPFWTNPCCLQMWYGSTASHSELEEMCLALLPVMCLLIA